MQELDQSDAGVLHYKGGTAQIMSKSRRDQVEHGYNAGLLFLREAVETAAERFSKDPELKTPIKFTVPLESGGSEPVVTYKSFNITREQLTKVHTAGKQAYINRPIDFKLCMDVKCDDVGTSRGRHDSEVLGNLMILAAGTC